MAAKNKVVALLLCFLFLAAIVSAEIIAGNGIDNDSEEQLDKGGGGGHHKHKGHNNDKDGKGSLKPSQCGGECRRRCSKTSHKKPCLFFCNKCCAVCLCVPPGTYGHKETCPCYNNWKTKEGGPKCP